LAKAKFLSLLLIVCVVAGGLLSVLQLGFVPKVYATTANFGYETAGTAGSTNIEYVIVGSMFTTILGAGTANSITASVILSSMGGASNVYVKAAIYKHVDSTKVGETASITYTGTFTKQWKTFTFTTPPSLLSDTAYVLVIFSTSDTETTDPTINIYYDAGDADQGHYQTGLGDFPATASFTHNSNKYSIYCTYTVTGLALDGAMNDSGISNNVIWFNLTTSSSPDVIIAYSFVLADASYLTVNTVTSDPALTWTRRCQYEVTTNAYWTLEEWCANWTSSGKLNITMTWSGTPANQFAGYAFGISGAETTSNSFDSNAGVPATANNGVVSSANPTVNVTTSNANDFIFGLESNWVGTPTIGTGYTVINATHAAFAAEYKVVSSTQSSLPVNFTLASTYWCMIGDAVKGVTTNTAPTIGSASGTNWDDTDNCYAQKKTYTVNVTYSDADGFGDIRYCELYLKTGGNTTRAEFAFLEDTNTWSSPAGSTQWTLTGQSNSSSGTGIAIVWGFQAQWDATEESDLDFLFFVNDTAGLSVNSVSDQNFDVVTRLVTSGFTSDDSRINVAGTTTISGTVYYANDPASNTSSASYPPDAEFTQGDIHDSGHVARGTDNTIVNGAFSASFAIPNAVQSNTYHVYINLADADGTDQDALDGDTTAVIGDRIKVNLGSLTVADSRIDINTEGQYWCTAQSEYADAHSLGAGDSLVLSGYTFTWDAGDSRWEYNTTQAGVTFITINSLTSVNEATYGITSGNINSNTATIVWDRYKVNAATLAFEDPDGRANVGVAGIFSCTVESEYDGHVLGAGDSLVLSGYTFTYNGTYWVNSTSPATPTSVTINSLTSVNEATYGITVGNINANSATGKWDRIRIDSLACVDTRIDVSIEGLFYCTATLETDGHALGAGDSLTLTGHVFSWNVPNARFEYKETNLTVTNTTVNSFTSGNEATYGITVGNINSMTATEVWDRYAVDAASLAFSDLDGRTNVGIVESFSCTVQSEYYDHHVLNGVGDTLTLSGHAFTYNGTYWVYSTSLAAPANIIINAVTSVYEATYGISAGNINSNNAVGIWDNLTVTNIQPVQYLGSGDYKYEAQLEYGYDLALISGGYVDLAYPNGTVVGTSSSNATGWVTFVVGQLNSTTGTFTLYGENETVYSITVPGANQTFANYYWTLAPQDVSGNSLTNTTQTVTNVGTTVWTGTATAIYVPPADFNVSISWLQNLNVNSTVNVTIAGDTTTDFNCTCYPYVIGTTRYWAASNATITSCVYAGYLLTVQFSCVNDSYVLVASYTTRPAYVLNVTYDYTTAFAPGYLVMPHFGNVTIVASYENWAGLYVKKTDHVMTSVGWAGQRLDIVTNGTVGDSGELDVYCASRGPPATTLGFTVTSYAGGVFVGLYTFASPHTASLEWAVASSGGPTGGPTQAASLFVTLAFTFPKTVQSGATVDGFLNVSWMGAAKVYIWSVVVDSDYAKDWELQITRLPWTLETLMESGRTQVPVVLYITDSLAAGDYSVPCDVTFQTVEGVSKTVRSILTFEVVSPIAEVPSMLVYVFLGGLAVVVTGSLFMETKRRKKYSQ